MRGMPATALWLAAFLASAGAETLNGDQIRELFTGNTIEGLYTSGGTFSEFHSPDGRALGDNGFAINVDACWNIDRDRVCYHYGTPPDRRTYCFTIDRVGDALNLRVAETGRLNGVAHAEKGNPRGHGDGGRRWSCDDLLSRAPDLKRFARRPD